jgi:hypothetical protein
MAGMANADYGICVFQCYPTSQPAFVFGGLLDGITSHEQAHAQCLQVTFPAGVDCPHDTVVAHDRFWGGPDGDNCARSHHARATLAEPAPLCRR